MLSKILTSSSITTEVSETGVSLVLTHLSLKALWTVTGVTVDAVNAGAAILAAVNCTVVLVHFTVVSCVCVCVWKRRGN